MSKHDEIVTQAGDAVMLDRSQAFLLYSTFAGDVLRTAEALGVSPAIVCRVADEDGWTAKLEPILALRKSGEPLDFERGLNRAINFVQAHRLRLFLERTLRAMVGWSDEQLEDALHPAVGRRGRSPAGEVPQEENKFSARALTDFAAALEKCHAMTYQALSDTASDRAKRKEEHKGASAADLHVKLAEAMASVGAMQTPRAMLLDAQLQEADAVRGRVLKPAGTNPLDDDDH